ncbi:pantoate-beta-alanine ligase [Oleoguttula sp. CCFEE 5521]
MAFVSRIVRTAWLIPRSLPTMGALHAGHLSLVRQAAEENSHVFVSIYVNPTQFGQNEDLASYPKTWNSDLELLGNLDASLEQSGSSGRVEAVFAPMTREMYPTLPPDSSLPGKGTFVTITPLAGLLEGRSRPVFFRGVATVCSKLFNIVQPERVYFGQKDVQQSVLIKRLVKDLHMPIDVRIISTEREADGLAMSSRNVYLGERRRALGVVLSRALRAAETAYKSGVQDRDGILAPAYAVLDSEAALQSRLAEDESARFEVDYISLADSENLEEVQMVDPSQGAVLSGAVKMLPLTTTRTGERLGQGEDKLSVRLIDNIILMPKP